MGYVAVFGCWLVAGVFGVAAVTKLRDFSAFADSIVALRLTTARTSRPLAAAVVAAELATTALCAVVTEAGLLLGAAMLAVFAWVALAANRSGRVVPCRCFGRDGAPLGPRHAIRNGSLAVVALAGVLALWQHPVLPDVPGLLLTGLVAGVAVALVISVDDLIHLLRLPAATEADRARTSGR